jgi:hypothetical protein
MMLANRDIYCAASLLIRLHGANAETEASVLAALMHVRGDPEKLAVWMRITQAITELQAAPLALRH